jgi:CubicO group peptidase (beta-lactamase class C family)
MQDCIFYFLTAVTLLFINISTVAPQKKSNSINQMKSSKISQPGNLTKEDAALIKEINLIAENALKRPVAGFSLGVMKDNRVILKRGYGFADLERKIPATAETRYQIGSITKQFTAAAILRLVEQKKINLDDEITKYLPEFSTQGNKVTIHHLLTHTSGIKNYSDYFFVLDSPVTTTPVAPQQILDSIKDKPFDFKPGERLAYNNSGYFLLGLIIERASGMPYAKFLAFAAPVRIRSFRRAICLIAKNQTWSKLRLPR